MVRGRPHGPGGYDDQNGQRREDGLSSGRHPLGQQGANDRAGDQNQRHDRHSDVPQQ
jgi:hypothetical protein